MRMSKEEALAAIPRVLTGEQRIGELMAAIREVYDENAVLRLVATDAREFQDYWRWSHPGSRDYKKRTAIAALNLRYQLAEWDELKERADARDS